MTGPARSSVLALALVIACGKPSNPRGQLTPQDQEQIKAKVAAAHATADRFSAARERGLRAAWRDLDPATASAPCGVKLPELPAIHGGVEDQSLDEMKQLDDAHWRMTIVTAPALLGEPPPPGEKMMEKIEREIATKGPRRDQFERQSGMLDRVAAETEVPEVFKNAADVLALATELGSDPYWGWELDVVASQYDRALFTPDGFAPGHVTGKALLWSFPDGRVVCAANVTATNQDKMLLRFDPNRKDAQHHHTLDEDLKIQTYRAAIAGMHAVR